MLGLSHYNENYRNYDIEITLNNMSQIWNPKDHALDINCKGMVGSWSYTDGGDKMKFVLNYRNSTQPTKNMSFDFITRGKQVIWTTTIIRKEFFEKT
jgi:hypothetical protein